jgi:hypothetical protein
MTWMEPQTAEAVRGWVLGEHAELRPMLEEIEKLAERFQAGDVSVGPTLRQRGFDFLERFSGHLELEERNLAPRLRRAGDRGRKLAEHLGHEHHEQRELLRYLLARLGEPPIPTLLVSWELRNFVGYVRLDMQHEEAELLGDDVLHD